MKILTILVFIAYICVDNTSAVAEQNEEMLQDPKTQKLLRKYIHAIRYKVQTRLELSLKYRKGLYPFILQQRCKVFIKQNIGGIIDSIKISKCNLGYNKKILVQEIRKSSPLPYKGFEKVFDPNINLIIEKY